ncbi:MAG: TIGR01777 family oxidoreductase [Bacteroidales bacterium]
MKVAISGASGFIGSYLTKYLNSLSIETIPLTRKMFKPSMENELLTALESADAVINLAGSTIARRWTPWGKDEIMESRIGPTRILVHAINRLTSKPKLFISASAAGIYPSDYNIYRESDKAVGKTFLSKVCINWEQEVKDIDPEVRLVIMRLGLVWDRKEGSLPKMLLPFKLFLGGMIGNGYQPLSWIHIDDVVRAVYFFITNETTRGIYNLTSPDVINNRTFTQTVAKLLVRPTWLNIPPLLLRIIFGGAASLFVKGQAAFPERLVEEGFIYKYDNAEETLTEIIKAKK